MHIVQVIFTGAIFPVQSQSVHLDIITETIYLVLCLLHCCGNHCLNVICTEDSLYLIVKAEYFDRLLLSMSDPCLEALTDQIFNFCWQESTANLFETCFG